MPIFRALFDAHALADAIKSVTRVQGRSETLPILEGVLLRVQDNGLCFMHCSNLEQRLSLPLDALDVEQRGTAVLPAKRVRKTLSALPRGSDVDVCVSDDHELVLRTDQGTYKMHAWRADDYPDDSSPEGTTYYEYEADAWCEAMQRVAFAISGDALRPAMMGALLAPGDDLVVATDGHRLAIDALPPSLAEGGHDSDIIVPQEAVQASLKAFDADGDTIGVSVSDSHVRITQDATSLLTRRINETYPNWQAVMPDDNDHSVTVDRERLLAAVQRVGLYSSNMSNQLRLTVEGSGTRATMTLQAKHIEASAKAEEGLGVTWDRPNDRANSFRIGFNASYLSEVLSHLSGDDVTLTLGSANRAAIVTDGSDAKMLVMPVMLNSYQA